MSKRQSKVTARVDFEDGHEDPVDAIDDKRQTLVRDSDLKGWHVLKHGKSIDVVDCSTEVCESLERSFIEDHDGGDCSNESDDDVGSVGRFFDETFDDDVCQQCGPVDRCMCSGCEFETTGLDIPEEFDSRGDHECLCSAGPGGQGWGDMLHKLAMLKCTRGIGSPQGDNPYKAP